MKKTSIGTNKTVLRKFELPIFEDIYSLADNIGVAESLLYILSENAKNYYKSFAIPKRNGKKRIIYMPSYSMKIVQRWILEEILYKLPVSEYTYGFCRQKGSPLKRNAEAHAENLFIFKLDLKNFFPSIDRDRIYFIFKNVGYNALISNILANICTLNRSVPQGAVTSPYLSNLVCYQLDIRIAGYCNKRGIEYSRYADDLTFSSNDKSLLHSIYRIIKKIITDEGFKINNDKTKFLTPKMKKSVTGVTINDGQIKAPKELKRRVRAMIHKAIATGDYCNLKQIQGYISYISSIEPDFVNKTKQYIKNFSNKPLCIYEDIVNKFNENKIFSDLDNLLLIHSKILYDDIFESQEFQEHQEHYDYLKRLGISFEQLPDNKYFYLLGDDGELPF